jgi:hypothetical protein
MRSSHTRPGCKRAVFVGQRKRVLVRHRIAVALRVVGDVAASRMVSEPLADVALSRARTLRGMSHRFVQAELLADQHQRTADDRAHVRHRLTHKGFELALVDLRYPPKKSRDDRSVWAAGRRKQTTAGTCMSSRHAAFRSSHYGPPMSPARPPRTRGCCWSTPSRPIPTTSKRAHRRSADDPFAQWQPSTAFWPGTGIDESGTRQIPCKWAQKCKRSVGWGDITLLRRIWGCGARGGRGGL